MDPDHREAWKGIIIVLVLKYQWHSGVSDWYTITVSKYSLRFTAVDIGYNTNTGIKYWYYRILVFNECQKRL